jgi:hypothetical protein
MSLRLAKALKKMIKSIAKTIRADDISRRRGMVSRCGHPVV